MKNTARFAVNRPEVAAEMIDGEVVVVSFGSGKYYSMRGSAADIWQLIEAGANLEGIVASFAEGPDAAPDGIRRSVTDFITDLRTEGLVIPSSDILVASDTGSRHSLTFSRPELERFDEMKEMLLYDPIHDVDETGWPHLPEMTDKSHG